MPRDLSPSALAALASNSVTVAFFISLELSSGDLNLCTMPAATTIGSTTYTGVGQIVSIDGFNENSGLRPNNIRVTLHWSSPELIMATRDENFKNRPMTITMGLYDESMDLIDAFVIWSGKTEMAEIIHGQPAGDAISVVGNRFWADWDGRKNFLYTSESQQKISSGDRFFEFVSDVADGAGNAIFADQKLDDLGGWRIQNEGGL